METHEQKRRKLFGRQKINAYLNELVNILLIDISADNLISIVKTDEIRKQNLAKNLQLKTSISFDDKSLLGSLMKNDGFGYYLFISYSNDCGAVRINSLNEFNFEFPFNAISSGLITLTREDLKKEIVLDFYKENGREYLEIEIYNNELSQDLIGG